MYKRYESKDNENSYYAPHNTVNKQETADKNCGEKRKKHKQNGGSAGRKRESRLLDFIPRGLYNFETGKVFGIISPEDLLIAALIIVLIDEADESRENQMLIYALLYILISEYVDLPF